MTERWGILGFLTKNFVKTQVSKVEALKEIMCEWSMNPEQILAIDSLAEGAITHINQKT
ncbi:MAG: hypothetical protein NWE98_08455 [Candidatus Bathyarchaeota archaeon]|nr:hypothetical protein [Candidatus Bathyarchaeota archaeon]